MKDDLNFMSRVLYSKLNLPLGTVEQLNEIYRATT